VKAVCKGFSGDEMAEERVNKVWLAVVFGLLVATSNTWLAPEHHGYTYDAPWNYPADSEKNH
jgi:hypothetical protein